MCLRTFTEEQRVQGALSGWLRWFKQRRAFGSSLLKAQPADSWWGAATAGIKSRCTDKERARGVYEKSPQSFTIQRHKPQITQQEIIGCLPNDPVKRNKTFYREWQTPECGGLVGPGFGELYNKKAKLELSVRFQSRNFFFFLAVMF